jgi:hypothetical protein
MVHYIEIHEVFVAKSTNYVSNNSKQCSRKSL